MCLLVEHRGTNLDVKRGLLGALVLASSTIARAEDRASIDFAWIAPPGCPSQGEVQGAIDLFVGRSVDPPLGLSLEVRARATSDLDGHWNGSIETRLGATRRTRNLD